jgi:hypothetical protein
VPDRELTDRERAILDFERAWPPDRRGKGRAVRVAFGFTPARYYQVLAELVDRPAARRYDALLVLRLRRRRRDRVPSRPAPIGLADQGGRGHTQ